MTDFWLGYFIGAATCVTATGAAAFFGIARAFRRDPVDNYADNCAHGEWPRVPGAGALDNQEDGWGGRP